MATELVSNDLIQLAINQGIWAVLFVALLFYVLRNGESREARLVAERKESEAKATAREEKLLSHMDNLAIIGTDLSAVKADMGEVKGDIKYLKGRMPA